jgi:hypothetical protein
MENERTATKAESSDEAELSRLTGIPVAEVGQILRHVARRPNHTSVLAEFLVREIPRLIKSEGLRRIYTGLTADLGHPVTSPPAKLTYRRTCPDGHKVRSDGTCYGKHRVQVQLDVSEGHIDAGLFAALAAAYYRIEGPSGLSNASRLDNWLRVQKDYAGTIYDVPDNPYSFD